MNPWTGLLESLHSALIDELVERHPEPKPELGMPARFAEWTSPPGASAATEILIFHVFMGEAQGLALMGMDKDCARALKMDAQELWNAMVRRAGSEFLRRKIQPRLQPPAKIKPGEKLPKGYPEPSRVIWIPIRLGAGACFFGIGV